MDKESGARKQTWPLGEASVVSYGPGLMPDGYYRSAGEERTVRVSSKKRVQQLGSNFMSVPFDSENMAIMYTFVCFTAFVLCISLFLFYFMFLEIHSLFYFTKISVKDELRKKNQLISLFQG